MANCPNCGAPLQGDESNCQSCGWVKPAVNSTNQEFLGNAKFCSTCGAKIPEKAEICPKCGVRQKSSISSIINTASDSDASPKSRTVALLLSLFLGVIGIHRFYVGKTGTGILMILLCATGISEIWDIIDFIKICTGSFTDSNGKKLTTW